MSRHHFVGSWTNISGLDYDHTLTQFGQVIELTDEQLAAHPLLAVVSEEEFSNLEITPDELNRYPLSQAHFLAPKEFQEKADRARAAAAARQQKSLAPTPEHERE